MKRQLNRPEAGGSPKRGRGAAPALSVEDYRCEALEALDALLAGPLGGGLGGDELEAQFPVIRAALRQIRSDLDLAWSPEVG